MAVDINPIPRFPVFTPRQAIAYARAEVNNPDKDYTGMCLHFTAWCYGFDSSGVKDATSFWRGTPSTQKTAGDRNPPAGAIALWTGGSHLHGHASIVVGKSPLGVVMIASNDIRRKGKIDIVPLSEIEQKWGLKYAGWAKPYYPFAVKGSRKAPDVYADDTAWGNIYQAKLHYGVSKSPSVKKLQHALGIKTTGNYNAETKKASVAWMKKHQLPGEGSKWSMEALNLLFRSNYFVHKAA